jgi:hypothetical protein
VDWSCQWEVDGHWRQQACGPGMSEHRPVWILKHTKGPEGKPLKRKPENIYLVRP